MKGKMALGVVSSLIAFASKAEAINIKVTIENIAPLHGTGIAQFWTGFHDGSFDAFNVGQSAIPQVELLAEDGLVGLEGKFPGILEASISQGLNISNLPLDIQMAIASGADLATLPPPSSTFAGLFAQSAAGMNGGIQDMLFVTKIPEPFFLVQTSGEVVSKVIQIDDFQKNRFFSYAAMMFPTNDGFIANDHPMSHEIFDAQGNFLGADFIVAGSDVYDAGTEVNDEDPMNVLYTLDVFGNSVDENGTIQSFPVPGFLPPGSGGIVDFEFNGKKVFANSDFTVPNSQIARITITQVPTSVPEPFTGLGLCVFGGSLLLHKASKS